MDLQTDIPTDKQTAAKQYPFFEGLGIIHDNNKQLSVLFEEGTDQKIQGEILIQWNSFLNNKHAHLIQLHVVLQIQWVTL